MTGGGRGLGAEVVRALHDRGAAVALSYLSSKAAAQSLVRERAKRGPGVLATRADVSDERQARRLVEQVVARFGRLDFLVNCASYSSDGLWNKPIDEIPAREFARVFEVDLLGTFNACKFAVPVMRRQRFGRIVNFSSAGALGGDETMLAYNAVKVGVVGLTRTLARQVAREGVCVNAIAPGSIDTGWVERWQLTPQDLEETLKEIPVGRLGQAGDVVHAVLFLLSERAGFITGQTLRVDGGVTHG